MSITYKTNPSLANWVQKRGGFFKKCLSESHVATLNEICFAWECIKRDVWTAQYNPLVEYKLDFGDCRVKARYKANPSLAYFVSYQHTVFKKNIPCSKRNY